MSEYAKQFESPRKDRGGEAAALPLPPPPPPQPHLAPSEHHSATAREPAYVTQLPANHHRHARPRAPPPLFPPPVQRTRCRTAVVACFRAFIALAALAMVALSVAGQLLPYCAYVTVLRAERCSVWQLATTRLATGMTVRETREDNAAEIGVAIASAALSLIACVLCWVFLGLWVCHERQRRREAEAYAKALRAQERMETRVPAQPVQHPPSHSETRVHHPRAPHVTDRNEHNNSNSNNMVHSHHNRSAHVTSEYPHIFGTKEEMYSRERRRRRVDRDVGIAAFSFFIAAALASAAMVALMVYFYLSEVTEEVDEGAAARGESAALTVGFVLFVVVVGLGLVAFVMVAMPCLTELFLCCGPRLRTPKSPAATVDSESESEEEEERDRVARGAVAPQRHSHASVPPAHDGTDVNDGGRPVECESSGRGSTGTEVHRNQRRGDGAASAAYPPPLLGQGSPTLVHHRASAPPPSPPMQPYAPTVTNHVASHHVPDDADCSRAAEGNATVPPPLYGGWQGA